VNEPSKDLLLTLGSISFWMNEVYCISKMMNKEKIEPGSLKNAADNLAIAQRELRKFKYKGHYDL